MKVLLVGSGGREHALAWKLSQAPTLDELHAAPGNPGIATLGTCHPVRAEDGEGLLDLASSIGANLVVVGPEAPLVAGVADELRHLGLAVFGPSAEAARIEGSKSFAKDVMHAAGVPTAETLAVARAPCVVKADGLAAGKGVFICQTKEELDEALQAAAAFGDAIVIEELLEGEEVSLFALCDGVRALPLPAAQDFKRIGDGDSGPNTGGMGSYSPVAGLSVAGVNELVETIHQPVLAELAERGSPFVGALFAGVMLTAEGPRVLEFNCRLRGSRDTVARPTPRRRHRAAAARRRRRRSVGARGHRRRDGGGDGRACRRDVSGSGRRRQSDRRYRGRRGGRRARLPRGDGISERARADERRPNPQRHRQPARVSALRVTAPTKRAS